jgi:uncharacterized protein (DUF302 family)
MEASLLTEVGRGEGYGFARRLSIPIETALERVRMTLKDEGFGVLTEINIREKFKEKLGVDFPNYVILGACNPPIAHSSLQEEMALGLLLPCNVVVYEENGATTVAAINAARMLSIVGNPALEAVAVTINHKLKSALLKI